MKALIIEDEARSARELSRLVAEVDEKIEICAILESVEQSLAWLQENPEPDLIFADIQLTDGLSFTIFEKTAISCPIIFCTAFDDYLMNAFDTNAISYLLKPITREKVAAALDKLRKLKKGMGQPSDSLPIRDLLRQIGKRYRTTILVNAREKIIPLPITDIGFFYMNQSVIEVSTKQGEKYFLTITLEELERTLDPEIFYRANRQFIINRTAIVNVERFFSRKMIVNLTTSTDEPVIISKARSSEFLDWLSGAQP